MHTADEILKQVEQAIAHLPYTRKPETLYLPVKYVLSMGGKRIRPTLMLLAYNLYKDDPESIMEAAIGLETYHNYTLLHDDLMDKADVRRGKPTVHKRWDENTAILSGDSMLVLAYEHIVKATSPHCLEALNLFTQTALEIGEGQQYDMDFESRLDVTEQEYIEMIRLKTSVLLACAVKMGALLAGAPREDADNLYKFGEAIGLAFQLQDDFLDVYGDEQVFGKAIGGDIVCNKKTFMLINALNRADKATYDELLHWLKSDIFIKSDKIKAVTGIYNRLAIDRLAKEKIQGYFLEANTCLERVSLPEERKAELRQYAARLMGRQK